MSKAKILFSCNAWHTNTSKKLAGVFTNDRALKRYLIDMKGDGLLNDADIEMIQMYQQTQGRTLNYLIEEHLLNPKYNAE
ncbi:MAG: hypothetical protein EZS26_001006 [Candidatus Ordinivivax streblomastigis]|uniref:Uncharacterized protein n=1 Tax=Candidatus Ordinivivax streblomastigis TaxID=2540710 RepID=A0A5M8P3D7_9BACT|nr:MAG: hypothetical protein EZS26_001006 [Candidatus Ordinivivax streblomastigis]